jgi:hypothetical protein
MGGVRVGLKSASSSPRLRGGPHRRDALSGGDPLAAGAFVQSIGQVAGEL